MVSVELIRAAKIEKARRVLLEKYRRDPMLWVQDRLGEDPKNFIWSQFSEEYQKHNWDGDKNPIYEAWMTLVRSYEVACDGGNPPTRIIGMEAATGGGKTYFLARLVYWFLDCFPNSLVITTAPMATQLKSGLWSEVSRFMGKIKRQHPKSHLYTDKLVMIDRSSQKRVFSKDVDTYEDSFDGWKGMTFTAGTEKNEESAVKARGFHRKYMLIILEECSGMNWAVVNAFQNTCTGSFNYIVAVGNPNNKADALNLLLAQKNTRGFRLSAYDHPNIVLQKEVIEGAVTQVSINDRADTYGAESRMYNAMVRGISPDQAFNSLILSDWFDEAIDKIVENPKYKVGAVGVDVAASENGDKACVAGGNNCHLNYLKEFQCPNATYLAYNLLYDENKLSSKRIKDYQIPTILEFKAQPEFVGIDGTGVGVATVEAFKNNGYNVVSLLGGTWKEPIPIDKHSGEPMWKFNNLRSQMFYELREDFRKGEIGIHLKDKELVHQLRKELMAINMEENKTAITIEGKDMIKKKLGGKSPNLADAVAYWNWVRKGYRVKRSVALPLMAGKRPE